MRQIDPTDRKLIALLKNDGRASITTLAGQLGVSRATVQHRMDALVQSGTIRRFTVEIDAGDADDMIHAIANIRLEGNLERSATRALEALPEVQSLYSTNGAWDLVVFIEALNLSEFDSILRKIRHIRGVKDSETSILLDRAKGR